MFSGGAGYIMLLELLDEEIIRREVQKKATRVREIYFIRLVDEWEEARLGGSKESEMLWASRWKEQKMELEINTRLMNGLLTCFFVRLNYT